MIHKIKKIKKLGLVFEDYSWNPHLLDFKRYNLIYGWTGSGKTTLSDLFSALEKGALEKYPDLEYELETQAGTQTHSYQFDKKVRVFNQDYISKNIGLLEGKANPIFILGEENQKLAEAIKKDENVLETKSQNKRLALEKKEKNESSRAKLFTDIARTISSNTSGEATRKYDKRNAEDAFNKLSSKALLSEEPTSNYLLTLKQLEKPRINSLQIQKIKMSRKEELNTLAEAIQEVLVFAEAVLTMTADSVVLERLKLNPDLSTWVEQGVALHKKHKSKKCEYCNSSISENRLEELNKHFNEADKSIKNKIDSILADLSLLKNTAGGIIAIDKANLYEELQASYQVGVAQFLVEKSDLLIEIDNFYETLIAKKLKTTETLVSNKKINAAKFLSSIDELNTKIEQHNLKTDNFKSAKDAAQKELEKHYLSTIYDEIKDIESSKITIEAELTKIINGDPSIPDDIAIDSLSNRITENRNKISSPGKACSEINKKLETFLGRKEIIFEVHEEGYLIKRNGEIAAHLSEGEKTAIAFVYFVVHLYDQEFDLANGVVVIDDPISSLDSNSLFQAFAFLKNAINDAHQVFILTHNFDFLRLVLNWLKHHTLKPSSRFYMIKNDFSNNQRRAEIVELDKDLQNHESEYHYLFKILYTYKCDGTLGRAYPIPNIARKVLEHFLLFRVPNCKNIYDKIESLKEFDQDKRTAIYKFTNDQSHLSGQGFNPSLVPETQKNVTHLLEMIQITFPEHYKILVDHFSEVQNS